MPAAQSRSSTWSSMLRPPTRTSGFGIVSVIGRMRLPSPAASTMAVVIEGPAFALNGCSVSTSLDEVRQVPLAPRRKPRQGRMREISREIRLDARKVAQVLGLAVAPVQAGEDAEHLGGALRGHDRVGAREARHVETC